MLADTNCKNSRTSQSFSRCKDETHYVLEQLKRYIRTILTENVSLRPSHTHPSRNNNPELLHNTIENARCMSVHGMPPVHGPGFGEPPLSMVTASVCTLVHECTAPRDQGSLRGLSPSEDPRNNTADLLTLLEETNWNASRASPGFFLPQIFSRWVWRSLDIS